MKIIITHIDSYEVDDNETEWIFDWKYNELSDQVIFKTSCDSHTIFINVLSDAIKDSVRDKAPTEYKKCFQNKLEQFSWGEITRYI